MKQKRTKIGHMASPWWRVADTSCCVHAEAELILKYTYFWIFYLISTFLDLCVRLFNRRTHIICYQYLLMFTVSVHCHRRGEKARRREASTSTPSPPAPGKRSRRQKVTLDGNSCCCSQRGPDLKLSLDSIAMHCLCKYFNLVKTWALKKVTWILGAQFKPLNSFHVAVHCLN